MSKTVLFIAIQFSISTQFSSIRPIDRTISDTTNPNQRGPGSDGNEGILRIPQSSSITGTSPLNCLVPYQGHSLGEGSYSSAEMQSVYSASQANWAIEVDRLESKAILVHTHTHTHTHTHIYIYIYIYQQHRSKINFWRPCVLLE